MGSWLRRQFAGPPPPREGFTTTGMMGGDAVGIDGLGVGTPSMGGESGPPSQLPTAFAAIKVLSGIQGNLPRVVHEREAPAMKPIREPAQRFLWGPPHMDCQAPKAWWVQGFAHFEGWANVYFWRSRLGSRDTALFALHPSRVSPFRDAQDRKRFVIDGNHDKIYTGDDILHIPGLMFDDVKGIPPVQAGAPTHALANLQGAWSRNFLRQGAGVSGIVNLEGDPTDDVVDQFYEDWDERHSGAANVGSVVVLSGAGKFERVTVPPEEAQLLESQQFSREQVLSFYAPGLPHHLLGWDSQASNWGTGIEQLGRHVVEFVLLNRLEQIEDAITNTLLPPDLELTFDVSRLLRGDLKTQSEIALRMRQHAVLSAEEWRGQMGMAARNIGDDFLSPQNMNRLDARTGELIEEAKEPAPMAPPQLPPSIPDPDEEDERAAFTTPLLLEARCQNDGCPSRRGGRPGKLLAQNVGAADLRCPDCKQTTRIARGQVLRDGDDVAEAVAERLNRRMLAAGVS